MSFYSAFTERFLEWVAYVKPVNGGNMSEAVVLGVLVAAAAATYGLLKFFTSFMHANRGR